jgi:hypothetical protein
MESPDLVPGQVFVYRQKRRLLRAQSGAGQLLGTQERGAVVFVRVFDVSGDQLMTRFGFLPLTRQAYESSRPEAIKRFDLPADWEEARAEWEAKRRAGEAGVFTSSLREVTEDVLATVKHLRDVGDPKSAVIELAYPKRSASGRYDTVVAIVRSIGRAASE